MSANDAPALNSAERSANSVKNGASVPNSLLSGRRAIYVGDGDGHGRAVRVRSVVEDVTLFDGVRVRRALVEDDDGATWTTDVSDLRVIQS